MKKALFVAAGLLASAIANAAPMAPESSPVTAVFTADVSSAFLLLRDSDDPQLLYYVMKNGGISVDAKTSANPIPRFQVFDFVPSFGFWAGSTLTRLGGSFDTVSQLDSLSALQNQATAQGYRVQPAPVTKATVSFLLGTNVLEGTRLAANCVKEQLTIVDASGATRVITVPNCTINDNGQTVEVDVMQKFSALPVSGNSVASQAIPFAAVTLPDFSLPIRTIMNDPTGNNQWDGILSAKVDWEIKSNKPTRQARVIINWSQTFSQLSTFFAIHNNACVDVEIQALMRRLSTCNDADRCGVKIEYLNPATSTYTPVLPNDPDFVNQVSAFQQSIQSELMTQVDAYSTSQLGQVSTEKTAYFTLRANYEKLTLNRNETRYFTYTPGFATVTAATDLKISCMSGGFETGSVKWNMDNPGCKALIGQ